MYIIFFPLFDDDDDFMCVWWMAEEDSESVTSFRRKFRRIW
jgi:hypothetical protein